MSTATLERNFTPSAAEQADWETYFRAYDDHQRLVDAARAKIQLDDKGNEIEPEPELRVVRPAEALDAEGLPRSPKTLWKRLSGQPGWALDAQVTSTEHAPVVYKTTNDKHTAGDVWRPGHMEHHVWIKGVLAGDKLIAAFVAEWLYSDGLKTPSWKFVNAQWNDIVTNDRQFSTTAGDFNQWVDVFARRTEKQ